MPREPDFSSYFAYDFCVNMATLATLTGNPGDVSTWTTAASNLYSALQTYCWDATNGWFQPVMTPSSPSGGQSNSLGQFRRSRPTGAFRRYGRVSRRSRRLRRCARRS